MEIVSLAAKQIFTMFVIIIIAVVCYKKKLIDNNGNNVLSNLLLYLINPCILFCSYQKEFDAKMMNGLLISLALALASHLLGMLIAALFLRNKQADLVNERLAVIYTNCGFLAIPLVNEIYGYEGVFYLTAYITVFNFLIWSHGIICMRGSCEKKDMLKAVTSPASFAIIVGIIFYVAGIILPDFMMYPLEYLGDMNTPVAMLIAGVCIARTDITKTFKKPRIYLVCLLKLIILPLVFICIFKPFFGDGILMGVLTIATASPTATMCMIFAVKYDKNSTYASELFAVTTLLSLITIPLSLFFLKVLPV